MFEKIENNSFKRRLKNHLIGREHIFFAVVQPGFESTCGTEFSGLNIQINDNFIEGGVEFTGRLESCYRASLLSRTAGRIMMRMAEFRSVNYFELERQIRSFPWELYLLPGSPIEYRTNTAKSMIYHTGKLEEIFTLGISERLASHGLKEQFVGPLTVQTIFLRNHRDLCTVSLDVSGKFLHKRGSGKNISRAPLRETTAALILLEAGIKSYSQIIDPMCGSGTFSVEAASILTNTPPAYDRDFPFLNWPCFRESTFRFIKNSAGKDIIDRNNITQRILTSDIDAGTVEIAKSNIPVMFNEMIKPEISDFFSLSREIVKNKKTLIVLNPPYGKRLDDGAEKSIYKEIGNKIRKDLSDCGYSIIVPGQEKENILALKYDRKIPFMNGGIKSAVIFKDA